MLPEYEPKITSHYGTRKSPHKKKRKKKCFHSGIDLQAKKAAPIYAAASGVVIKAAREHLITGILSRLNMEANLLRNMLI